MVAKRNTYRAKQTVSKRRELSERGMPAERAAVKPVRVGRAKRAGAGRGETHSSRIWGYIEGFYGRIFTWEDRGHIVDRLSERPGGAYLYAPKEDHLHRRDWRLPYPKEWRMRFGALAARGRKQGTDLVPGLAPGLSYDYLDPDDYLKLLAKFRAFQEMGCRTLALLMDDIPPSLPEASQGAYRTLGEAHGVLLRMLRDDLNKGGRRARLWFCPTVYTDQFASGQVRQDPYLNDLAATMPREVTLMWTGPRIISEKLGRKELAPLSKLFQGNILLWDNLYANDYCPNKLFVGPYLGRGEDLWKLSRGALLNPTGLRVTDSMLLDLLIALVDKENPLPTWRRMLERHAVPGEFLVVAPFLASPFFVAAERDLTPKKIEALRRALKSLIWDWKGPLHQEWYPYLFMLDADLKASGLGAEKPDRDWIRKRYSPLIARLLLK